MRRESALATRPLNADPNRLLAFAALVVAMVLWGSTFVVTKVTVQEFPPLTLAFLRFAIASACLLVFMRGWQRVAGLGRSVSFWRLAFLAASGIALFTALFNYALVYGSALQGALLYATTPAVVAVCAALWLKERLDRRRTAGIALSVGGAVIVVLGGQASLGNAPAPLLGALLMFSTVLLWGAYTVAAKRAAHADQLAVTFAISALGALMLLPGSVIELSVLGFGATSDSGWLGLVYLGVFSSAACYALYNFALRQLDASTVGVYSNIDPVVGVATAFVFLGEQLAMAQAFGATVVFAGMWLASTEARRAVAAP